MNLNIVNEYDFIFAYENDFRQILYKIQQQLSIEKPYLLSCIFVDDNRITEINKTYRNIHKSTDVISFALLDDGIEIEFDNEIELGDIFINIDACSRQALSYEHSFKREICFLFTHGVLHLLGYDHMRKDDETVMFALQEEILHGIVSR